MPVAGGEASRDPYPKYYALPPLQKDSGHKRRRPPAVGQQGGRGCSSLHRPFKRSVGVLARVPVAILQVATDRQASAEHADPLEVILRGIG